MRRLFVLLASLIWGVGICGAAHAQVPRPGTFYNCSLTVGTGATNITFSASRPIPLEYIAIQNVSTNDIWYNVLSTATTAAPSWHLFPGGGYVWDVIIPSPISVIASASSSALTCYYR